MFYADRVLDTSVSTGTGALVVSGTPPPTWQTFSTVCVVGTVFEYCVVDPTAGTWETGDGRYSAANTIARDVVRASSSGGTAISFAANSKQVFMTARASSMMPSGMIIDFAGSAAPVGWLLCDGAAVSRTTYQALFAAISTTYGVGNGSTTFNVPDLRGRVTAGLDGGTNRLQTQVGTTLGATGGTQTHGLSASENAGHTHNMAGDPGHVHSSDVGAGTTWLSVNSGMGVYAVIAAGGNYQFYYTSQTAGAYAGYGSLTGSSGTGAVHQNTQPTIMLNKLIKV